MTPRAPSSLRAPGRRLWDSVVDHFELEEHEVALLVEAVRTVDNLDQLEAAVRRDGPLLQSEQGPRAHPALIESRQQRIALARLLAALRLPAGETDDRQARARAQRRVGARGVYGIGSAS